MVTGKTCTTGKTTTGIETDDELYERKLYESGDALVSTGITKPARSPRITEVPTTSYDDLPEEKSVYERLRDSNFNVRNPISLQFMTGRVPDGTRCRRREDPRPEVLGDHRIAVMSEYAPTSSCRSTTSRTSGRRERR